MTFEKLKVNHYHVLNQNDFSEVVNSIAFASNSQRVADIIRIAHPCFTDMLLALALNRIAQYEMPLNESFEEVIVPFATAYTKLFSRHHSQAFAETVIAMGKIGCKNQDYWNVVRTKIDEGMARYMPLHLIGEVLNSIAQVGQADAKVMQALGGQVIKHQAGLPGAQIQAALEAFESAGVGAEAFKKNLALAQQSRPEQRALHN